MANRWIDAEGETVAVRHRREPLAPIGASEGGLVIRPATRSLQDVPLPPRVPGAPDAVALLTDDRADRFP